MVERPSTEILLALHKRLATFDAAAPAELVLAAAEPLTELLNKRERRDPQLVQDAVTDALFDLIKCPSKFDPCKGEPWTFMVIAAKRNLLNLLRSRRRATNRDLKYMGVALGHPAGNWTEPSTEGDSDQERAKERLVVIEQGQADVMTDIDHQILRLIANGERATGPFAQVLGISALPDPEQRRHVKNAKDRLLKRLRRVAKEGSDE